jgi:pyrroline-5-carboxylate reductase
MAEAMIKPLTNSNLFAHKPEILFTEPSKITRDKISSRFPSTQDCTGRLAEAITGRHLDMCVVAVKPQNVTDLFGTLRPALDGLANSPTVLSICAGVPISTFTAGLGTNKVFRSMPNTPAMIERGVTVWSACKDASFSAEETDLCKAILGSFGTEIEVDDEKFIDMATSISGSGPAYIFLLIESMVDTAVHMGFGRDTATKLVHQTLLGSTLYAMKTGEHPATLRNSVTSPAGTTASAVYELEKGGMRWVVSDAIWACYRRSLEMGGNDSNVGPGRFNNINYLPLSEFPDFKTRTKGKSDDKEGK